MAIVAKNPINSPVEKEEKEEEKIIQLHKSNVDIVSPASILKSVLNNETLKKLLLSPETVDNVNRFSGQMSLDFPVEERIVTNTITGTCINSKGKANLIKVSHHSGTSGTYIKVQGEVYKQDLQLLENWFTNQEQYSSEDNPALKRLFMINNVFFKEFKTNNSEKLKKYANYIARQLVNCFGTENLVSIENIWVDLLEAYTEEHRVYHTLKHIYDCLIEVHEYQKDYSYPHLSLATSDASLLKLALIFHDFVYEVGASDNEERSAEKANELLEKANISQRNRDIIKKLILTTKPLQALNEDSSLLEELVSDIDLFGFSLNWIKFLAQNKLVASEFMPDGPTVSGIQKQISFLSSLLKTGVYRSDYYKDVYEHIAKANISKEISRLQAQIEGILEDERRKQESSESEKN